MSHGVLVRSTSLRSASSHWYWGEPTEVLVYVFSTMTCAPAMSSAHSSPFGSRFEKPKGEPLRLHEYQKFPSIGSPCDES